MSCGKVAVEINANVYELVQMVHPCIGSQNLVTPPIPCDGKGHSVARYVCDFIDLQEIFLQARPITPYKGNWYFGHR